MKKITAVILMFVLLVVSLPQSAKAEGEMMKIYLVPIEQVGSARGPEYFVWKYDANPPSIGARWNMMDYGFINVALLVAHDITPADHAALILQPGVYAFPDNLDAQITDKAALTVIFEAVNLPTDWLTASSTYRELLRKTAGMMQFNQRYAGISGGSNVFSNGRTLDSNYNSLSAQEKAWFVATLQSFGWLTGVQGNPKLRTLAKQAGDLWGAAPFYLGGFEF